MNQENTQGFKELQPGTVLNGGKYTIERKIGEGGFGITYKAVQGGLNRAVCIKEYFPAGKCMRDTHAKTVHLRGISAEKFEKYRQAFVNEARTLAGLHHPNIVEVIDVFDENGTSYMVMPFIEGQSLQQIVDKRMKLPYQDAVNYIGQITAAIGYIHERHILHRDIKPDNVMITADHRAILIDFGSARQFEQDKTQSHTSMLTHGYAPNEQYTESSRKGSYTDIYALGATFYFSVTGKVPVEAPARMVENMVEPGTLSDIPDAANRTIMKAMQLRPENRHQSSQEFMDDLLGVRPSTIVDESIGGGSSVGNGGGKTKRPKIKRLIIAIVVGVVIVVAAIVGYDYYQEQLWQNHVEQQERIMNGGVDTLEVIINDSLVYIYWPDNGYGVSGYYFAGSDWLNGPVEMPTGGVRYTYTGQMKDARPHGDGEAAYDDGSKYSGAFIRGKKHGRGKLVFASGETYEGDYENDAASGRGKMTYADGSYYEGRWANNLQNGYGKMVDANGIELMRGTFEDGNLVKSR